MSKKTTTRTVKKAKPVPAWLNPHKLDEAKRQHLTELRQSWFVLSNAFKTENLTEQDLLDIAVLEMQSTCRPIIVQRLLSRYRTMRNMRENDALVAAGLLTQDKLDAIFPRKVNHAVDPLLA